MEFCRNRPGSRRWFHRPLLKVRFNFSTGRKLFMILRVFVSSWWIGPGLYHEDAKTQRIAKFLVAAATDNQETAFSSGRSRIDSVFGSQYNFLPSRQARAAIITATE